MPENFLAKQELRREKIRARESLSPAERWERSLEICRRVLHSAEYRRAKTVMIYRAVRGEVQLSALEEMNETADTESKKHILYPLCGDDRTLLAIAPATDDANGPAWRMGPFGIPEPDPERGETVPPESIDLVICPCTAFDVSRRRLGMGGGYYDRFLRRCPGACIAAVAFEVQKAERVPSDGWDIPMQRIFTECTEY